MVWEAPLGCLDSARYGIIGNHRNNGLLRYSIKIFKRKNSVWKTNCFISTTTKKLAEMITEITKASILNMEIGSFKK